MQKLLLLLCITCGLPFWKVAYAQTSDSTSIQRNSPYRYVNATSLKLRIRPDATAMASAGIAGASRVQLLQQTEYGWTQIQVNAVAGYVRSEYLVETQDQVSADIDWEIVEKAGGAAYSSLGPASSPAQRKTVLKFKLAA